MAADVWPLRIGGSPVSSQCMGGRGGSKKDLLPMTWEENQDFSDLPEKKWIRKYPHPKQYFRNLAPMYEEMHQCHVRGEPYHLDF